LSAPIKEVALSVNAPTEDFIAGSNGVFTFTVYNNTTVTQTVQVRYGLPHHTWETGDRATYGDFQDLVRTVVVGPQRPDTVYSCLCHANQRSPLLLICTKGGALLDETWFQTRKVPIQVNVVVRTDRREYWRARMLSLPRR